MNTSSAPTKKCSHCGIRKPLSAFLCLNSHTATYGSLCETCRGAGIHEEMYSQAASQRDEDNTVSTTGFKIDAKTKIQIQQNNKNQFKKIKEDSLLERKKIEKNAQKQLFKHKTLKKNQQIHQRFVTAKENKQRIFAREHEHAAEKTILNQTQLQAKTSEALEHIQQQEDAANLQNKLTSINLNVPYIAPPTAEIKYQGTIFKQFKEWLGPSAHIRTQEIRQPTKESVDTKTALENKSITAPMSKTPTAHDPAPANSTDLAGAHAEKHWNPFSK